MQEDIKEYLNVLDKIKYNKKRLIEISLTIEEIITNTSNLQDYLKIYTLEKEAVAIDSTNHDLQIDLMRKEIDYTNKYHEVITLEKEISSYNQEVEYPNDYNTYIRKCDDFLYKLKNYKILKEDKDKIKDSINSNINRRIIYESFKNNKNIYYYLNERKKYQEENNMI